MRAPVEMLRRAGEELERGDGDLHLGGALPLHLPVVSALELGERIGLLVEELRQVVERAGALGRRGLRPGTFEGASRRDDGRVDVIGPGLCDGRQLATVGGVEGGERSARCGVAQLAADDELRGEVGHGWSMVGQRLPSSSVRSPTGAWRSTSVTERTGSGEHDPPMSSMTETKSVTATASADSTSSMEASS